MYLIEAEIQWEERMPKSADQHKGVGAKCRI